MKDFNKYLFLNAKWYNHPMTDLLGFSFSFPLALLLFCAFMYWIFNFVIIYHLTRFGVGVQPKRFAVIFFLGSVFLSGLTLILFLQLDMEALALILRS